MLLTLRSPSRALLGAIALLLTPGLSSARVSQDEDGALQAAREHVAAGKDVDERVEWYTEEWPCVGTRLHKAVRVGHLRVVEYLLSQGADVANSSFDIKGPPDAKAPLAMAARNGDLSMARLLVSHGADATHHEGSGDSPLHCAAMRGHVKMAKYLAELGASVNPIWEGGEGPLHAAAGNGHFPMVEWLLERGAGIDYETQFGGTPLQAAARGGHGAVMVLLVLKGASLTAGREDQDLLTDAVRIGDRGLVELLIARGAQLDGRGKLTTPVYAAVEDEQRDILVSLLLHGASPDARSYYGDAALHEAAERGDEDFVGILLWRGADPNITDSQGRKPADVTQSGRIRDMLNQ